jgi:hypothetical protein
MRIVVIRENAANLADSAGGDTLLRHEEHIGDGKIDLWKNRKQPEQHPPKAEENDEGITCRARPQDFGETISAIEAAEVYDQGGIPKSDSTARAAVPMCAARLAAVDDKDLNVVKVFLRGMPRQKLVFDGETLND